ncbi:unnamed protein product [Dracunculus medinensis]|uniref:Aa_trans domain-containing protein n=1 Tax=Dracunculus medinensis TaxID=318479 RepID=A0A0N4UND5_DRAME|nr:unnamed protein product [Dracunculus medinensis]
MIESVGLAFQAYPEVASNLPLKQLWAILFFLMITILGLDSQVCMLEGLLTAIEDVCPSIIRKYKQISLAIACSFFFLIGIPMVSYAGSFWLTLVDAYGASGIALLFVVFFEVVGLSWGFGGDFIFYKLIIYINFFSFLFALFFFCIIKYQPLKYPNGDSYPVAAEIFGIFLSSCSIISIPSYAIYHLFIKTKKGSLKEVYIIHSFINEIN